MSKYRASVFLTRVIAIKSLAKQGLINTDFYYKHVFEYLINCHGYKVEEVVWGESNMY